MIDLYSWNTSNGRKVAIMLEEIGLPYRYHPVDITKGDQFLPSFQAINPNSKIPAIVDHHGPKGEISIFESGAILIYLAEKVNSELLPADPVRRIKVLQWLMFQMGGIGPIFGQTLHFVKYLNQDIPYARKRFSDEVHRLFTVLDRRLDYHKFLVDEYSIADIATFPWVARFEWLKIELVDYPNVKRWFDTINNRDAIQRGLLALEIKQPSVISHAA